MISDSQRSDTLYHHICLHRSLCGNEAHEQISIECNVRHSHKARANVTFQIFSITLYFYNKKFSLYNYNIYIYNLYKINQSWTRQSNRKKRVPRDYRQKDLISWNILGALVCKWFHHECQLAPATCDHQKSNHFCSLCFGFRVTRETWSRGQCSVHTKERQSITTSVKDTSPTLRTTTDRLSFMDPSGAVAKDSWCIEDRHRSRAARVLCQCHEWSLPTDIHR